MKTTAPKKTRQNKQSGYDAANNRRRQGRDVTPPERTNEDGLLPHAKRVQLISSQRDSYRNTTFSPATAQQLQVNVVGNEGGHLTFTTGDAEFNRIAGAAFAKWARHCEFSNGISLNELLQLLLVQLTHTGGDFIAVFDDGCICGSGKVRVFEADEIRPLNGDDFQKMKSDIHHSQSNGIVYDRFGRISGAFVSSMARGADEFKAGECLHLRLDTPGDFSSSNWIFVGQRWRVNQGRGVATSTHVTNCLADLADTRASEVQAGKLNSSIGLIVTDKSPLAAETQRGFTDEETNDPEVAAEIDRAASQAAAAGAAALKQGASALIRAAPNTTIESFDTKRPSNSTVEFIRNLEGACATVFGIGLTYVTLNPDTSYTAFRGAMLLARLSFEKLQKKLERDFLDWLATRFVEFSGIAAPEGYDACLFWQWPTMREVDETAYQTAIEKKFTNFEISLQSRHGADWKKFVDQIKEEAAYCSQNGVLHPCLRTVSGGQIDTSMEAI